MATNTPQSTINQYQNAPIVGDTSVAVSRSNIIPKTNGNGVTSITGKPPKGAEIKKIAPAKVNSVSSDHELRVRIIVPPEYLDTDSTGGFNKNLVDMGGILFPYTPQISLEHVADYASQSPIHSNYQINFYKNSKVSDINISGVFTVQNDKDAITYLSIINVLRSLTKGRFGGDDPLRGSPPPVCRLMAYGTYMLDNVPISIATFKNELPNDVDYYYLEDKPGTAGPAYSFGKAYVPVRSTITLSCKIMYSRNEMLGATIPLWQADNGQRLKGLL